MQLSDYLALFPSASREKPRFMALAEAVLSQVMDLQNLVSQIRTGYSVGSAAGVQLDAVAAAVGLRRESGIETDVAFRQYLLAKLCLWGWDGSNECVPAALAVQPGVTVSDNGNGTVSVSPSGMDRELVPVSAGIGVS